VGGGYMENKGKTQNKKTHYFKSHGIHHIWFLIGFFFLLLFSLYSILFGIQNNVAYASSPLKSETIGSYTFSSTETNVVESPNPQQSSSVTFESSFTITPTTIADGISVSTSDSFGEALGTFSGGFVFILVLALIVFLLVKIYFAIKPISPSISLELLSTATDSQKNQGMEIIQSFQAIFTQLYRCTNFLNNRIAYDAENLKFFGLYKLLPNSVVNPEKMSVKVSVGPFELNGIESLWNQLIGKRNFHFFVSIQPSKRDSEYYKIDYILTLRDKVIYSDVIEKPLCEIDETIINIACCVIWAISQKDLRKVEQINIAIPPDIYLIHGIYILVEYLKGLINVQILEEAVSQFQKASRFGEEWRFQAGLLEAITLQLTQAHPQRTVEKMKSLLGTINQNDPRHLILLYNFGQALFYTYVRYQEAISVFSSIQKPKQLRYLSFLSRLNISQNHNIKMQYRLYCLSQANIAITQAHQIYAEPNFVEKEAIAQKTKELIDSLRIEISNNKRILEGAFDEIQWRLYNAEAMISLNLRIDIESGKEAANKAIELAPHALDVKANLGSLCLLLATQKNEKTSELQNSPEFILSDQIFTDLHKVGWDPGFVKYRLGIIRRIQGKFSE
jgi:hypothetical protein